MEKLHLIPLKEQLKIEKEVPTYELYCDMDGVLCDFEERFEHFTGNVAKDYKDSHGEKKFWDVVNFEIGERFWSGMQWMEGGKELWRHIEKYKPVLLTSPSRERSSRIGKTRWVENNLGSNVKIIFSNKKYEYATQESILIDDRKSNLEKFKKAGGITIRCAYGNSREVIEELKKLGYE